MKRFTILFFLVCCSYFLPVHAQSSQPGGFTYGWANYDNSDTPGLGSRTVNFDFTGIRSIPEAPAIGVHPRVFFGPSEIPDIQNRLQNTASGQAVSAQIHAFTTLLHLDYPGYNHNAPYGLDADGNRLIGNAGFWNSHPQYYKLINEDPTVWDGEDIKRKHLTSTLMALEAFECLMNAGGYDPDTGMNYDDRAADLAKAMTFWAGLALNDPDVNPDSNNYNNFGGTHMALAYDLNYNSMTPTQRDSVRQALALIIPDAPRHGGLLEAYANTSNWSTLNSFEIIINLAIEGETGYKPDLTDRWMRALHNFINYGWYPSGAGYEGLGKNYMFVTTMIACAKRGYSLLGHPHVKTYGTEFLPAITQPFGHGFTSYDVWGGSGYDDQTGGYKFNPADVVGLKWIFPNDSKIDLLWRNYIEKSYDLSSEGYVYQQIRPDDSYYNYLLPAAIFCSDYDDSASWESQSNNNVVEDYFAADRGLAVMRSGTDANALAMQFHCRQDMGGHTHGDKNDITLSGLGRIWIRKTYGGSPFQPSWFHSCILVDDIAIGVGDPDGDKVRMPGTIMEYEEGTDLTQVAGDATYPYTWEWHWSPQTGDHPWLGSNGWEKVTETWNDFLFIPQGEAHFNLSFYDMPHWHQEGKFERMVKRQYNPMEKVYRTVGMIKGDNPFVLVVDDVKKDGNVHNYKWLGQIARDLEIESTDVNLDVNDYRCDVILKEPATEGNRRLLVRVLYNEGYDGSTPPGYVDTLTYIDFFSGNPYNSNPNLIRPRLIVESNSVDPKFKILLYPHHAGDPLPTTVWNTAQDQVSVTFGTDTKTIAFFDDAGRTDFEIVEPCLPPENAAVDVTSSTTATLTWDAVPGALKYQVRYRLFGTTAWTTQGVFNNIKYLTGLQSQQQYEYRIRVQCADGTWSDYTTLQRFFVSICDYPDNILADILPLGNAVHIHWDEVPEALKYQVRYGVQGTGTWTVVGTTSTNTFKKQYELLSATTYDYRVRSMCPDGTWSQYSLIYSFTTQGAGARFNEDNIGLNIYSPQGENNIYVKTEKEIEKVEIYHLDGRKIQVGKRSVIEIPNYISGVVLVRVFNKDGSVQSEKVMLD